ncbi:Bifunctional P-450:NADPH-P450 reductase [Taphrina deformans PYCC 5710]|uniref:Bifunctional P-450:NADPH-P450 reductase n=1 Tax=Taphrina deformans (strain PYCC 5710 / ATCC 11124 / CBS 356.35 / IMI 108563 / JCM 9778 / NBRC 8474) TaxID=1097556 RepID=R4X6J0_TAPDE|nr:Bifunctional P-450:NADPH-P450 reductase [Taphrina deformans PYCC 5710]|eukprot:CCG80735.1 Bifunctional P-450:NADPH-P450 reductase [Taphrina deformans PYCC 5710]
MLGQLKRRSISTMDQDPSNDLEHSSARKEAKLRSTKKGTPIPGNSQWDLVVGKLVRDLDNPLNSVRSAHGLYGNIFTLTVITTKFTILSSQEFVNAMLSDPKTRKVNSQFLEELRIAAEDGLFTAHFDEPNWAMAHRILIPAFGAMSVRGMYDQMIDISSSMIQRWNAHQGVVIDIPDQLTRLTLDTIALCSFDYRFNSFFKEDMHPFVQDMVDFLSLSAQRALKPISATFNLSAKWKWQGACKRMQDFADNIIVDRKENPRDVNDLCRRMLDVDDPETGEKLSSDNVRAQLLTFLVAGHETTSGLLSFCLYYMVKNPQCMRKAQAEVDAIGRITRDSLTKMPYIDACLKETLRLQPTAPMFSVENTEDKELPGGYIIPAHDVVLINLHGMQSDPKVWGENAQEFEPERMMDGKFENLLPNSWKPFGHGARACIGRAFAVQESILAIASILQNFDLELDDPTYELRTKFTLTIKPENLKMKVRRRQGGPPIMPVPSTETIPASMPVRPALNTHMSSDSGVDVIDDVEGQPVSILYGSNSGSCEALAKELRESSSTFGVASSVATLDSCLQLPTDRPVVIITASYEGKPCDNAKQFAAYLESKPDLRGVKFGIFGAGHHDWVQSYMHVPRQFETTLIECGAKPLLERGEGDVAGDFIGEFEAWKENLFQVLSKTEGIGSGTATPAVMTSKSKVDLANIKNLAFEPILSATLNSDTNHALSRGVVISNEELVGASALGEAKRHISIKLPENETYETGDYLSILPTNPTRNVQRVLRRFKLSDTTKINVRAGSGAQLLPVRAFDLLQNSVELATPVQRRLIPTLAARCSDAAEARWIETLGGDDYRQAVLEKRLSHV